MVQTGPKTQEGGAKGGIMSFGYQVETEAKVKRDPIPAAMKQIPTARMKVPARTRGLFPDSPSVTCLSLPRSSSFLPEAVDLV